MGTEHLMLADLRRTNELARSLRGIESRTFQILQKKGVTTLEQLRAAHDADLLQGLTAPESLDEPHVAALRRALAEFDRTNP